MRDTIFVRVPKTASRSVMDALQDAFARDRSATLHSPWRHHDCRTLMRQFDWPTFYKFAFVRNPWGRIVSAYLFQFTDSTRRAIAVLAQEGAMDVETVWLYEDFWRDRPSFDDWILGGFERFFMAAKNQLDFLVDERGKIAVDFIGRFENLEADFARVCQDIGCPGQPLAYHRHRTEHRHYTEYYTPASRDRVARAFARDVECFGYEFGA